MHCAVEKGLWEARIPEYGKALIEALRIRNPDFTGLKQLPDSEWRKLLRLCDASQTTLMLRYCCPTALPTWVDARTAQNYMNNCRRYERLRAAVLEIARSLRTARVDFVLLKGLAHAPEFTPDPILRSQGDVDLWCQPERITETRRILSALGYRAAGSSQGRHLDPMIREKRWEWKGDYYAPDLPIPIDVHYELWDERAEFIAGPSHCEVWSRRQIVNFDGDSLPVLDKADALMFSALHLLMHLLHGDIRLQRAWEIARFLDVNAEDESFWSRWLTLYSRELILLQTVVFLLAQRWFHCRLPVAMAHADKTLSAGALLWIRHYGFSPIEQLFSPNKDELWLHLQLLKSHRARARVLARRLLPVQAAASGNLSWRTARSEGRNHIIGHFHTALSRLSHHAYAFPQTCFRGFEWWRLHRAARIGG